MRLHPLSFLLGVGAAFVVPLFTRVFRPFVVEAAVTGMGVVDEGRRLLAEQMETFEDIVAEARARREELLADGNGHHVDEEAAVAGGADETERAEPRRRGNARRRTS